uniref:Uncharacterized protein n=1 Tax=viral metagenome TaxID=1070528 RepID=A0A6C0HJE7_9ZZZZ
MSRDNKQFAYYDFVGKVLVDKYNICRVIQGIYEDQDPMYRLTRANENGRAGTAYRIHLMVSGSDEAEYFHFRNFSEVVAKYGELIDEKPAAKLTIKSSCKKSTPKNRRELNPLMKWAKIYPEQILSHEQADW